MKPFKKHFKLLQEVLFKSQFFETYELLILFWLDILHGLGSYSIFSGLTDFQMLKFITSDSVLWHKCLVGISFLVAIQII